MGQEVEDDEDDDEMALFKYNRNGKDGNDPTLPNQYELVYNEQKQTYSSSMLQDRFEGGDQEDPSLVKEGIQSPSSNVKTKD